MKGLISSCILCFWIWVFPIMAQHRVVGYEMFTTRDGLSHNTVLNIQQDHKGVIWMGSFNGITRYDGSRVTSFKDVLEEGRSWGNIIECTAIDKLGKVWIASRTGNGVAFYNREQGTWKKYYPEGNLAFPVRGVLAAEDGNIWVSYHNGTIGVLTTGDSLIRCNKIMPGINRVHLFSNGKGGIYAFAETLVSLGLKNGRPVIKREQKEISLEAINVVYDTSSQMLAISASDGLHFFQMDSRDRMQQICFIPLLLQRENHKIRFTNNGTLLFVQERIIQEYSRQGVLLNEFFFTDELGGGPRLEIIYDVMEDRSGLVWIATSKGVLYFRKQTLNIKRIDNYSYRTGLLSTYIRALYVDPKDANTLWLGTREGYTQKVVFDRPGGSTVKVIPLQFPYVFYRTTTNCFYRTKDGKMLVGGISGCYELDEQQNIARSLPPFQMINGEPIQEVWCIQENVQGNLMLGTHKNGLLIIDHLYRIKGWLYPNKGNKMESGSIWQIYRSKDGTEWLGTDNGLYFITGYDESGVPTVERFRHPALKANSFWNICEDQAGNLWLGTTDNGLYRLSRNRQQVTSFWAKNLVDEKTIAGLMFDEQQVLWVSSTNGLWRLDPQKQQVVVYTEEDGLLSNDFNFKAVAGWKGGYLLFGTKSGVCFFHPDSIYPKSGAEIFPFVTELAVRASEKWLEPASGQEIKLSHQQNDLAFKWALPEFSYISRHRFKYRLLGYEQEWNYTDAGNPQANYTNLLPGEYQLELQGSLDGNTWITPAYKLKVDIEPAFWQTLWFRILLMVLFVVTLGSFVYLRVRTVERRAVELAAFNKRAAELELQALQSQMNPHFIFNAINSIQHFIFKRDELRSSDYLTKFARLMRSFLEASRVRYITLEEELRQLSIYIELEHLRFEDKFRYQIEVDPLLNKNQVELPSLLLQPFLENAINHGLVQRKEPGGFLLIGFYALSDKGVLCVVDDNGIGRAKAATLKKQTPGGHKSRGIDLVMDRIKTVNELKDMFIEIRTIDKIDSSGNATGTRIEISISYNNYNLQHQTSDEAL